MAELATEKKQIEVITYKDGPTTYKLKLSMDEARALKSTCGNIIGSSDRSARKYTDDIWAVLRKHTGDTYDFDNQFLSCIRIEDFSQPLLTDPNEDSINAIYSNSHNSITLILNEQAAMTVAALTGKMPAYYESKWKGSIIEHLHSIFEEMSSHGFGSSYMATHDFFHIYDRISDPRVKIPERKPKNWPPKYGDVWLTGNRTIWYASPIPGNVVKLHVPTTDPVYFSPDEVLKAWPDLHLVFRLER